MAIASKLAITKWRISGAWAVRSCLPAPCYLLCMPLIWLFLPNWTQFPHCCFISGTLDHFVLICCWFFSLIFTLPTNPSVCEANRSLLSISWEWEGSCSLGRVFPWNPAVRIDWWKRLPFPFPITLRLAAIPLQALWRLFLDDCLCHWLHVARKR